MATGEKGFSTADVEKTKRDYKPISAGDYDLKLLADKAEIRTADPKVNPKTKKLSTPVPRVSLRFEVLNSAKEDGGKNALLFHDLHLKMAADAGGVIGPTQADQLKGLTDALGADGFFPAVSFKGKNPEPQEILDPRVVLKYIKEHNGEVIRAHVEVQAGTKDYPAPKNRVTEFFAAGEGGEAEGNDSGIVDENAEDAPAMDDADLDGLPPLEEEKPAAPAKKAGKR